VRRGNPPERPDDARRPRKSHADPAAEDRRLDCLGRVDVVLDPARDVDFLREEVGAARHA
jgi:hypothetical protein